MTLSNANAVTLTRTDSTNAAFVELVSLLDRDLAERDGADNSFYAQFNKVAAIRYVIVASLEDKPIACGAIKAFSDESMEVKRMFTLPDYRGKRIASLVLDALENWAKELGYRSCVLETGKRQPEAIALYRSKGYEIIPNYGQYIRVKNSICFLKRL
ncbi:MAG: N-acetyltransferase [Chitinophagaceae bacterium]|nr:MAG: N-acetyltransferase [Chitinophagaceae bacterium]